MLDVATNGLALPPLYASFRKPLLGEQKKNFVCVFLLKRMTTRESFRFVELSEALKTYQSLSFPSPRVCEEQPYFSAPCPGLDLTAHML